MTQEQKAKAYDEAIERAKIWQNHLNESGDKDYADELEYIFPELAESEDERIRKEMLNVFKQLDEGTTICGRNYDYAKWIAWLEKQGESYTKKDVDDAYLKGVCDTKQELEKQGEQKPNLYSGTSFEYNGHIWGMCARDGGAEVSMDGNLKAFISSDASFIYPDIPQPNLALKSALEEFKEEKVDNANKVEQNLANSAKTCKKSQRMVSAEAKEALYDKAAWSEEDEEMLDGIILRCEKYGHQEQIKWLKSIKQRIKGE